MTIHHSISKGADDHEKGAFGSQRLKKVFQNNYNKNHIKLKERSKRLRKLRLGKNIEEK